MAERSDQGAARARLIHRFLARVRAGLRRRDLANTSTSRVVPFGGFKVDLARRQVRQRGEHLHLTPVEYKLAAALVSREGQVLTHRQLLREVWGPGSVEHSHYLRIYLGHLRRKLEADPARPVHFLTETGVGYRFVAVPMARTGSAAQPKPQ